jgi:hypothetical protein
VCTQHGAFSSGNQNEHDPPVGECFVLNFFKHLITDEVSLGMLNVTRISGWYPNMKRTLLQHRENGRLTFGTGGFGGLETLGFNLG